jgi:hypothetical protein
MTRRCKCILPGTWPLRCDGHMVLSAQGFEIRIVDFYQATGYGLVITFTS